MAEVFTQINTPMSHCSVDDVPTVNWRHVGLCHIFTFCVLCCPQCFDAVGWATGRASGL